MGRKERERGRGKGDSGRKEGGGRARGGGVRGSRKCLLGQKLIITPEMPPSAVSDSESGRHTKSQEEAAIAPSKTVAPGDVTAESVPSDNHVQVQEPAL